MLDKNIVITNEDIQAAVDTLNSSDEAGIKRYSKFLFSEAGIILRLEVEADYVPSSVKDDAKLASARIEFNGEQAQIRARYPNLSDEDFEAQLRADDRAARIAQYTQGGLTAVEAAQLVDQELSQEDTELAQAKAKEGFDLGEYKFEKWVIKNNKDVMKQVFIISGGKKLHIDYTFDQGIVGVAGGATLGEVGTFGEGETITFDSVKEAFGEYIANSKFNAGLAFISRISDVSLSVALG